MLELPKMIIISKCYQLHAKISTPTGTAIPVEKVKEISSNELLKFPNLAKIGLCKWTEIVPKISYLLVYGGKSLAYTPSGAILRQISKLPSKGQKTKKLGINGHINISKGHQIPIRTFWDILKKPIFIIEIPFYDFQPLISQLPLNRSPPNRVW